MTVIPFNAKSVKRTLVTATLQGGGVSHVVHQEVMPAYKAEPLRELQGIVFSPELSLIVSVRPLEPYERAETRVTAGALIFMAATLGRPVVKIEDIAANCMETIVNSRRD